MARDRVFINSSYRSFVEELKQSDLLGFNLVENKDSFMLAVALGVDSPTDLKNKDGWFLLKNMKTTDKALAAAVLLGIATNDVEVDEYSDLDRSLDLCERCAESGFKELKKRVSAANGDRELLERRFIKELDLWYANLVESDLD